MSWSAKRKAARERDKRARERSGHLDTNDIGLRRISQVITMPGVVSDMVAPLLAPDRMRKDGDGRSPPRELVAKLRTALGVHALCAYHGLNALYDDSERSRGDVADAAGMSFWHLRRTGIAHISELTLFNNEDELIVWAGTKYKDIPVGAQIANNRERAKAELSAVSLLGRTYVRAQRILSAFEEAETILRSSDSGDDEAKTAADTQAHDIIEKGYASAWHDATIGSLIEIAIYADINPVMLWPKHISFFAELFELARFVGRINAGIGAKLETNLFEIARQVMDGYETGDSRDLVSNVVRHHLVNAFPGKQLIAAIDEAERNGLVLSVARGTRRIALGAKPVVEAAMISRWQKIVSVLRDGVTSGIRLVERCFGKPP